MARMTHYLAVNQVRVGSSIESAFNLGEWEGDVNK
jgi:hypothetical protein